MSTEDQDLSKLDRGDDFVPTDDSKETDQKGAEKDDGAAKAAEDELPAGKDAAEEQDDAKDGERTRDDKGRFTKKDDDAKDDEPRIPKSRFDEQMGRERSQREAAERRAAELEEKLNANKATEDLAQAKEHLQKLIKERNAFLADGKLDQAEAKDMEILEFQSEAAAKQARAQAAAAKEQAKEEIRYDAAVTRLEATYPQINPDAEEFDEEKVREVQAVMAGFQQTMRMPPSVALEKAAKLVLGEPKKAEEPSKEDKSAEAGMRRKAEAVDRNAKVADKQPPKTDKVGVDHDKAGGSFTAKDVMKMSHDEFSKLSDEALAKMRGDYIS
jgi:hypothetical protein